MDKFYLEADIKLVEKTEARQKAFAAVIELPRNEAKQPDLQYFSAIFVSAGTNLNGAHFLPSELVKAEDTIVSKALDVEHKEEDIIGHIYDRVFISNKGAAYFAPLYIYPDNDEKMLKDKKLTNLNVNIVN